MIAIGHGVAITFSTINCELNYVVILYPRNDKLKKESWKLSLIVVKIVIVSVKQLFTNIFQTDFNNLSYIVYYVNALSSQIPFHDLCPNSEKHTLK